MGAMPTSHLYRAVACTSSGRWDTLSELPCGRYNLILSVCTVRCFCVLAFCPLCNVARSFRYYPAALDHLALSQWLGVVEFLLLG